MNSPFITRCVRLLVSTVAVLALAILGVTLPLPLAHASDSNQAPPASDSSQRELEDGTIKRTNPFPEILSDEQAKDSFAREKRSLFDNSFVIVRDGKLIKPRSWNFLFKPGDQIRFVMIMYPHKTGLINIGSLFGFYGWQYGSVKGTDGITRLDTGTGRAVYLKPKVYLNGKEWARYTDGGMWQPVPNDKTNLQLKKEWVWPRIDYYQYIEYRFTIPKGLVSLRKLLKGTSHNGTYGLVASTSWVPFFGERLGDAQFTPVDDFAYREAIGLHVTPGAHSDEAFALPGRSANKPVYSDAAFTPISNLRPLAKLNRPSRATILNNFPILRNAKHTPEKADKLQYAQQSNSMDDVSYPLLEFNNTEQRPSLDDLQKQSIPGYVYLSNDIDKDTTPPPPDDYKKYPEPPKGTDNSRISYAIDHLTKVPTANDLPQDRPAYGSDMKADYLTHKHYYLTYRQLPAPVAVTKVDADGNPLAKACFKLTKIVNGKSVDVLTDLCSDTHGKVLPDPQLDHAGIVDFIRHNNPVDVTRSVYRTARGYLLTPGDYSLVEVGVPDGYQRAEDTSFTVALQTKTMPQGITISITNTKTPTPVPTPSTPGNFHPEDKPKLPQTGTNSFAAASALGLITAGIGFLLFAASRRRR